jgi:hypothetical protein
VRRGERSLGHRPHDRRRDAAPPVIPCRASSQPRRRTFPPTPRPSSPPSLLSATIWSSPASASSPGTGWPTPARSRASPSSWDTPWKCGSSTAPRPRTTRSTPRRSRTCCGPGSYPRPTSTPPPWGGRAGPEEAGAEELHTTVISRRVLHPPGDPAPLAFRRAPRCSGGGGRREGSETW